MQKGKMAVWGGLTNTCEKKRSEKHGQSNLAGYNPGVAKESNVTK